MARRPRVVIEHGCHPSQCCIVIKVPGTFTTWRAHAAHISSRTVPHENASRYSSAQSGHRMRAKPLSKRPQSRYRRTCSSTSPPQNPYRRSMRSSHCPFTSLKCASNRRYKGVLRGLRARYRVAQTAATATLDVCRSVEGPHQNALMLTSSMHTRRPADAGLAQLPKVLKPGTVTNYRPSIKCSAK